MYRFRYKKSLCLSAQNVVVIITLQLTFRHVSFKLFLWSGLTRPWNLAVTRNSCQDSKKKVLLYQNKNKKTHSAVFFTS